ncbi:L,D-transpeptidase family protein [Shewanella avicenniae]|uniref:L,D-transpeptidase family protein n=1 Tax=Shewanella avicenniae TaxID=2814294 RepID=A0ABX7QUK9_9GAMM|nr:L,D-transpeptidase family protein [Shewanella avicenniae]QSX35178.1 L,D-transpeptidase family protein [Shewanella avicenniae]
MRIQSFTVLLLGCYALLAAIGYSAPLANRDVMLSQLRMISLLPEYQNLARYMAPLASSTDSEQAVAQAQQALAAFWQQQGLNSAVEFATGEPQLAQFNAHVSRLLALEHHAAWPQIQPGGWLRPGDSHSTVHLITERLRLLGDLSQELNNGDSYTAELAEAVQAFQRRHGLKVDGVIGPQTLHFLNLTPRQRATLLAQAYVQRTLFTAQQPHQFVLVNVPAFELTLVDGEQTVLRSKVVVGLPYRQTPMLTSEISSVVLNPHWNVPRSIVRRKLLGKIRADDQYLTNQAFDVYNYQGQKIDSAEVNQMAQAGGRFPYRLVQKPGPDNSLGRYKFHFSNSYDVYLHDTPEKPLFAREQRALSSGCVRVEKAEALAQWLAEHLMVDRPLWQQMQNNYTETKWFKLQHRLPVFIVYWPAWVDNQGIAQFRPDIYQKLSAHSISPVTSP